MTGHAKAGFFPAAPLPRSASSRIVARVRIRTQIPGTSGISAGTPWRQEAPVVPSVAW